MGARRFAPYRRRIVVAGAALILLLLPYRTQSPEPFQTSPANSLLPEIERYTEARERSRALRRGLEKLASSLSETASTKAGLSSDLGNVFQQQKREYFAVRETLFRIAFLHASAIVERPQRQNLHALLLKTSASLLAATGLVQNFHAAAALLRNHPPLLEIWNEPDLARGIPEQSWEVLLESYRSAYHRDLFGQAIERLKQYRRELESYRRQGDAPFLALYPQGIDPAFREIERSYDLVRAGYAAEDLEQDEKELRVLVERSKALRSFWADSAAALRAAIAQDGGLVRGHVHLQVHTAKRAYLELRESLYHLAFKHVSKVTRRDINYPEAFRVKAIAISLLAAVTLYENTRYLQSHVLAIPRVKDLLNQGDLTLGIPRGFWNSIEREFTRPEYRALLVSGIQAMEQGEKGAGQIQEQNPFFDYISKEMTIAAALADIRGERFYAQTARALRYYAGRVGATGSGLVGHGKLRLSKTFGNLVGKIEFRKGKLFNQQDWVRLVKERLEPGDLLLEKTPFRITDKLIPGHFGHVALYVGTEEQLRGLGLLDHPWVARHRTQIAEGKTIVEALRDGTQINTIEHFLNIDDLAILRPKKDKVSRADVMQAIALAFSHVGKKYDFNFDNNTWDTIVCSELAFQTYVNVRWPFAAMISSYTISPDDVAVVAGSEPSRSFDLITFIHDGALVHDQSTGVLNEKKYIELLGKRYTSTGF